MSRSVLLPLATAMSVFALVAPAHAQQRERQKAAQEKEELNSTETAAQEEVIPTVQHTVQLGETVLLISKKYVVSPDDIYKLNPEAIDGITRGMVLSIPSEKKVAPDKTPHKPEDISLTSHAGQKAEE